MELYKKVGSTFFLKVFGLAFGFLFQIILGRLLTPSAYGEFTMYITYSSMLSIIAIFGMDQNMIKEIAKKVDDKRQSNSILQLSLLISLVISAVIIIFLLFSKYFLGFITYGLFLLVSLLVIKVITSLLDGFLQGNGLIVQVTILNVVLNNVLKVIFFFIFISINIIPLNAALFSFLLGEVVALLIRLISIKKILHHHLKFEISLDHKIKRDFVRYSATVVLISAVGILLQNIDKIMIDYFLDLKSVGVYKVSQNYVALISIFITPFIAFWPVIAKLYSENKITEIEKEMKRIVRIVTYLVIPMFFVFLYRSSDLLMIFGEYYVTDVAKQTLLILCFSFLIDAISGPIGSILTMTNYAKYILYNNLFSLVLNMVLNYILISKMGLIGVAFATGISIIVNNVISIIEVKLILGIFSYDRKYLGQIVTVSFYNLLFALFINRFFAFSNIYISIITFGLLIYLFNGIILILTNKDKYYLLKRGSSNGNSQENKKR